MSEFTGGAEELFMKHVMDQFKKDQQDGQEKNNSFVFLENSTLNMFIMYLLMNGGRGANSGMEEDVDRISQVKVIEELELLINDNKKDFEEIIALLKEKKDYIH